MNDTNRYAPFEHAARLGFKISLGLTCVYSVLGVLAEIGRQIWLTRDLQIIMLPIARFDWAGLLPIGFLMVIGPTLLLGTFTGALIGELWTNIGRRIDGRGFALLALLLCVGIVVVLHGIFQVQFGLALPPLLLDRGEWPSNSLGLLVSYPFLVGVPSIVYVLTGAWGSYFFWQMRQQGMATLH